MAVNMMLIFRWVGTIGILFGQQKTGFQNLIQQFGEYIYLKIKYMDMNLTKSIQAGTNIKMMEFCLDVIWKLKRQE